MLWSLWEIMQIQQRLSAEELACQIIYSYFYILDQFPEEHEQKRGLAKWRLEIFDYVKVAKCEELNYILSYLKSEASVVYLEVSTMVSELIKERKDKVKPVSFIDSLIYLFQQNCYNLIQWLDKLKEGKNNEKICIDNSISIGGNCNADEYPRTNRSIE